MAGGGGCYLGRSGGGGASALAEDAADPLHLLCAWPQVGARTGSSGVAQKHSHLSCF